MLKLGRKTSVPKIMSTIALFVQKKHYYDVPMIWNEYNISRKLVKQSVRERERLQNIRFIHQVAKIREKSNVFFLDKMVSMVGFKLVIQRVFYRSKSVFSLWSFSVYRLFLRNFVNHIEFCAHRKYKDIFGFGMHMFCFVVSMNFQPLKWPLITILGEILYFNM